MNKSNLRNIKLHVLKNLHFYLIWINFLFILSGFYPGYMSIDSLYQYQQSKTMEFTDHHPPIMAGVWSLLNYIFSGPQGLLFFHLILFWSAILILFKNFRDKHNAYIVIFICYLPWILNFIGVLWKDIGMAFSLLLFFSLSFKKLEGSLIKKFLKISTMFLLIFSSPVRLSEALNVGYRKRFSRAGQTPVGKSKTKQIPSSQLRVMAK
jgi:hypothetical protein